METILVVDDEKNYLLVMATLLEDEGFEAITASSGAEALKMIDATVPDLILTDMTMPKMDGIALLSHIKEGHAELPVIMMTAFGTVEKAVEAMKKGAFDYISKPFKNEELMLTIRKALDMNRLQRENRELTNALKERYSFGNIIGKSKPMLEIYRLIEKVSEARATVLVTGESGTGKELIAKAVHYNSPRSKGPFVAVNCSALAESLLESELFGHEKGAFTDAKSTKKGRFELSAGGTLFLDEIGEMPSNLQVKLLRVIQERKFERVGGTETIEVDVRIVAATNRDLKQEVSEGRFREDLYYRLNVVHLRVPPLRERPDDLPVLVDHFIRKFSQENNKPNLKITQTAMRRIYTYAWPGNVRELENALERAVILSSGDRIEPEDLPEELDEISRGEQKIGQDMIDIDDVVGIGLPLNESIDAIEKKLIQRALEQTNHVQAHAAELLGIKKNVMQYKMKKHGLL